MRQHVELPAARDLLHVVAHERITCGYFEAIGIPLKRGRYFNHADTQQFEPVAIARCPATTAHVCTTSATATTTRDHLSIPV